jgi:DNA-binding MarR family transcriptional regulator
VLAFGGPMRITSLARAEQVRTPTMTPIVAALERDGLVTRARDASDARAAILRATPRGARLMAEGRARRVALLASDLDRLSPAERRTLDRAAAILQRLFAPDGRVHGPRT